MMLIIMSIMESIIITKPLLQNIFLARIIK